MLWIALVSLLVGESLAQIPSLQTCPDRQPVSDLDIKRFVGRWYEQKALTVFKLGCGIIDFTLESDDSVTIHRQQFPANATIASLHGPLIFPKGNTVGEYIVDYSIPQVVNPTYTLEDTDYDNWAIVTSCIDFPLFRIRSAWIATREQNPSAEILAKACEVAAEKGLQVEFFADLDAASCPADC